LVAGFVFLFSVYRAIVGRAVPETHHGAFVPIPRAGMWVASLVPGLGPKKDDKPPKV